MSNKLSKVQTETTYDVEFEGFTYTVTHIEDADLGHTSWQIFADPEEDNTNVINDILLLATESSIVEYVIENM